MLYLILSLLLAVIVAPVSAACRAKCAKVAEENQIIVPFAVPVGVPVAPFAPYFYSYQQAQLKTAANEQTFVGAPVDLPNSSSPHSDSASNSPTASLVTLRCATCHGGATPKAGLSLENIETLSASDRLRAVEAVVSHKMPKGIAISHEEENRLIDELATWKQQTETKSSPTLPTQTDH